MISLKTNKNYVYLIVFFNSFIVTLFVETFKYVFKKTALNLIYSKVTKFLMVNLKKNNIYVSKKKGYI